MKLIAIRNKNEKTDAIEMVDLLVDKTVWATVLIDFFHDRRNPGVIYNALKDSEGEPIELEITLAAEKR